MDEYTILAGFSQGVVCLVSIKEETCGHEIKAITVGSASIDKIVVCKEVGKAAIAIQGAIKFIDLDIIRVVRKPMFSRNIFNYILMNKSKKIFVYVGFTIRTI